MGQSPPQLPQQSDQQPQRSSVGPAAVDRHQIFEQIALERLRSGSDASRPVSFLPLPVRLTAGAAVSISALGVLWACLAEVPVQVNGIGSITPEVQVSSAIARLDGALAYQVSGVGPDRLPLRERQENEQLANYWNESWTNETLDYARLNTLALAALDNRYGQPLLMPESLNEAEVVDDLKKSNFFFQKLFYHGSEIIARIDNAEAQQELDAFRVTTKPKLAIDQSIVVDRRRRATEYSTIGRLLVSQRARQQRELDEREALLGRLQQLWQKGYVSTAQLLQEQSVVNSLRNQLLQLDRERLNTSFGGTDQRQQAEQASVNSLQTNNQLQIALVSYLSKAYSFAPSSGLYIVSPSVRNGMQVRAGDELFTFSVDKPSLPTVIPVFVDAATSQQLADGMKVLVTPKGISRSEFGGIPGEVVEVAKLPLPAEGVAAFAGGRTLAATIQQTVASSYLVRVKLQQVEPAYCEQMLSRRCYRWSSNRRPPFPVRLGTLADVQINVQYRRPIEFVMPALRQALGLVVENR